MMHVSEVFKFMNAVQAKESEVFRSLGSAPGAL